MVWAPHFYEKSCAECDPSPEWRAALGCKEQVSDADCKVDFMGVMKFYKCPRSFIRDASASHLHDVTTALRTHDYRATADYRTRPFWLIEAWNLITQQRNGVENYLAKHAAEEARNKVKP